MAKKQSATRKAAKKSAAKKASAKKTTAKKSTAKKSAAKKSAKKSATSTAASRRSSSPTIAEQLQVKQHAEYMGQNWWKWSVWIEAPSTVLDDIEYVDYKLHSSFSNPVKRRTNRQENFRLEASGWGEFRIDVEIKPKKANAFTKRHWLTLKYPPPGQSMNRTAASTIKEKHPNPTVFLSSGISDLRMGNALARALREHGIRVSKTDELSPDIPWDVAITEMTKNADLMVVLLSGRPTGWTMREIYAAKNLKEPIPIVPIYIGPHTIIPDELEGAQAIDLNDADEPDEIAPEVAMQLIDRIKKLPKRS